MTARNETATVAAQGPEEQGSGLPPISRRQFLAAGAAVAGGVGCAVGAARVLGIELQPSAPPPVMGTTPQWAFVVDTNRCVGCGLCVAACKAENDVSDDEHFARTWVERHVVTTDGTVHIDSPHAGIDGFPEDPPDVDGDVAMSFFEPRLCMQCADPPCTAVCPVSATYQTADGVVLVDPDRCIGCGYCIVACPYGARYLVPDAVVTPGGGAGVADKCTWCYHRITKSRLPACVEVCPTGARTFGDLSIPGTPIHERVLGARPLHPEFGTRPLVLYHGATVDGTEPA